MTFKDFISHRKAGYDERRDFVRLVNADLDMPVLPTWAEMRTYIELHHDNHRITEAGAEVWKEYQVAERKLRNAETS